MSLQEGYPPRPFGYEKQPIVPPAELRTRLLGDLGSLFTFDISKGTWGGRVEPQRVELRGREMLVIGGIARFFGETRGVGFINRPSEVTGSYFLGCEWKRGDMPSEPSLKITHSLPGESYTPADYALDGYIPDIANLDVYTFSLLYMTAFTAEHTRELQLILQHEYR